MRHNAALLVVIAAAVIPYVRLPSCPLFPDAERAVTRNVAVAQGSFGDVVASDFWGKKRGDVTATGSYRPAVGLTYWLEHRMFGARPAALHLFDMLLHATASVLVLLLLRRLGRDGGLALGGAALFAVHPALSEAVASVIGRADLMAGTALLGALLLRRRALESAKPGRWDAAVLVLLAVALLSKEYAVVFPFLLLLFDWVLAPQGEARPRKRIAVFGVLMLVLLVAYLSIRFRVLGSVGDVRMVVAEDTPLAGMPFIARLANALWLLLPALRLLFLPLALDHVYGVGTLAIVSGLRDPHCIAGLVFLAAAATVGLWEFRRRADPVPLLALALFVLPLVPALNTIGVTVLLFAERFLYVPAVGFVLAVVWALGRVGRAPRARRIALGGLALVCVLFAVRTARRVEDWRSNEALARAALRAHPRSAMALHELGMMLALRGDFDAAAQNVRASLDIQASRPGVWRNYALILDRLGRRAEAVDAWSRAVDTSPAGIPPSRAWLQALAAAQAAAGQSDAAIAALVRDQQAHPDDPRRRGNLGRVLLAGAEFQRAGGDDRRAAALAAQALDLGTPDAMEAFRSGVFLARAGDAAGAARAFERARRLDPGILATMHGQADAMQAAGRSREATDLLAGLVAADPEDAPAQAKLEQALRRGPDAGAERILEAARQRAGRRP